jgi:hypothetical protein
MKWLLFILVLASVGIAHAIPEQQNKPQTNQSDSKNIPEQTKPAASGGTEDRPHSGGPSSPEKENGADDKANQSDWCEKIISPLISNWPLVVVAIWGICIAVRTLKPTKIAAQAAQKSADAALLNAQAVINSERAWLDIDFLPVRPGESGLYYFRVSNHGKTPGFVTGWLLGRGYWDKGVSEIPLGSTGTSTPEKLPLYNIIPPNTPTPINILTFDVVTYPPGEEGQFVTYHGQLMYRDIFKQEQRTEIVYRFHRSSLFLEPLPKYTRYITKTEQGEEAN